MNFKMPKDSSVAEQLCEESQLVKQVDAAILSKDNNFLVQALLSNDAQLVKVAHNRVHTFCEMETLFCYS
jgi:hypothetical protein